jgi:hypothetical protein
MGIPSSLGVASLLTKHHGEGQPGALVTALLLCTCRRWERYRRAPRRLPRVPQWSTACWTRSALSGRTRLRSCSTSASCGRSGPSAVMGSRSLQRKAASRKRPAGQPPTPMPRCGTGTPAGPSPVADPAQGHGSSGQPVRRWDWLTRWQGVGPPGRERVRRLGMGCRPGRPGWWCRPAGLHSRSDCSGPQRLPGR